MKVASIPTSLCFAGALALAPMACALAQDSHQHGGNAAAPAAPQAAPSGAMQTMPPEMMQMMQMMQSGALPRAAVMGGSLMAPGGAIQHVEGHIAFLKAELKITEAQQKAWDHFAEALRTNAKELRGASGPMRGGMMGGAKNAKPLAARLEQQEQTLNLHLGAVKRSRAALEELNAVLSDEQKRQLGELN